MKTGNTIDITLLLVRIISAAVVGAHGVQKLLGWFGGYGFEGTVGFFTQTIGLPYIFALLIILTESIGMIALLAGLFSRILSTAIILIMLGAIFTMHGQFGFFMDWSNNQGGEGIEYHLLMIALSGVIVLNGPGVYAMDHVLLRKRPKLAV
jgi:putative oxidoreductase